MSLPDQILHSPHWRVNFRPELYEAELIPSLAKCFELIEQTKVRLRGWDYPHLSNRSSQREQGVNWVASWSDFMGHKEYWRLYQSGQFINLFSIKEAAEKEWRIKLEEVTKGHLHHLKDIDWSKISGFISIINFLYTVTEIFEFGARLCQKGLYRGTVTITIELRAIKGFVLTTEGPRHWDSYYAANENVLGRTWFLKSDVLVAESAERSLKAVLWFFERFGWLSPPVETLRADQQSFLKGRV